MSLATARADALRTAAACLTVIAAGLTLAACGGNDGSGVRTDGKPDTSVSIPAARDARAGQDAAVGGDADAGARGGTWDGGHQGGADASDSPTGTGGHKSG